MPAGEVRRMMPTRLEATCDWGAVVRVHRRHGTEERLLSDDEIQAWAGRVRAVAPELKGKGPVWVAWGTDWGDAPLTNARRLAAEVGEDVALDWAGGQKERARSGGVAGLFSKASAAAAAVTDGRGGGGGGDGGDGVRNLNKRPALQPAPEQGSRIIKKATIAQMFAKFSSPTREGK